MIILEDGKPFTGTPNLDVGKIRQLVDEGVWTEADLAVHGLRAAEPFAVPEGKIAVGEPRYVEKDGKVSEERDIEDAPPPPPEPTKAERLAAMLGEHGLSLVDLKEALAK